MADTKTKIYKKFKEFYGEGASDGWLEGDVSPNLRYSELISVKIK